MSNTGVFQVVYGILLFGKSPASIMQSKIVRQITHKDGYEGHILLPFVENAVMLLFDQINNAKIARNGFGFAGMHYDDSMYTCYIKGKNDLVGIEKADEFPPYASHELSPNEGATLYNYFKIIREAAGCQA